MEQTEHDAEGADPETTMTTDALLPGVAGDVGKDGRTDAIAEAIRRSARGYEVMALSEVLMPGLVEKCRGGVDGVTVIPSLTDVGAIVEWARAVTPAFVVVGPEEPLAAGAADALEAMGIPCFGPVERLARIESSKAWARSLVEEYGIPGNPRHAVLTTETEIERYLRDESDFVLKADGLRGGKGVRLFPEHFDSRPDAVGYALACLAEDGQVLVEERLIGEEFSLQTITDGTSVVHCPLVQDHKRAEEGDTGPNTGGMGSYSCADSSLPFLTRDDVVQAQRINELVIDSLYRKTGLRYRGVLYGGFIATADGVRIIEFNCRFGDPEALNVLPLLETDFVDVVEAVVTGKLDRLDVRFARKATVCKYLVPKGYPYDKTADEHRVVVPRDLADDPGVRVYWAASRYTPEGPVLTNSRALAVVGIGTDLEEAERLAQRAAERIGGEVRFRHDIGREDLVQSRVDHMTRLRGAAPVGR